MRDIRIRFGFLVALAWTSQFTSVTAADTSSLNDAKTALKVIAESYLEHRTSFPNLKVIFQWTRVNAESPAHALRGELLELQEPVRGLLITAAGRRRYEFLCGPQAESELLDSVRASKATKEPVAITVSCVSDIFIESDGYALRYAVSGGFANLFVPNGPLHDGVRVSPFNLQTMGADGASHPARYLKDALGGRFQYEYLGAVVADQADLTVAVISERLRDEFSFDPTRDYLLTRNMSLELKTARRQHEMRLLNAVECSGGRWLPTHAVVVFSPDDPQMSRFFEMRVLEHDPDYQDAPADWEMELPADTQISVAGEVQWTRTPKDRPERFQPEDFPTLHERCVTKGKAYEERRKTSADLAKGRGPAGGRISSLQTVLIINAVAIAFLGMVSLWRWRGRLLANKEAS